MTITASLALALSALAAAALAIAPALSAGLIRFRAQRLPAHAGERLLEEWLAELAHIRSRAGKLAFALRLFLTRTRSLVDAMELSDALDGQPGAVVLSIDGMQVAPTMNDVSYAGLIDLMPLFVLLWVLVDFGDATFLASWAMILAAWTIWVLAIHVVAVRLLGGTPGQRALGLRVVTRDGAPLSWRHVLRRAAPVQLLLVAGHLIGLTPMLLAVGAARLASVSARDAWAIFQDSPLSSAYFLLCIIAAIGHVRGSQREPVFDHAWSGTTVVIPIPRVVGVPDAAPPRSTSAMR